MIRQHPRGGVFLVASYPEVRDGVQANGGRPTFYLALGGDDNLLRVPYLIFSLFGGHR
jgi:hypothetical protein